jgi:subtilisin family serine protease
MFGVGVAIFFGAHCPTSAVAQEGIGGGALQQIAAFEQEKAARSAVHRKLDSHFVYKLKLDRRQFAVPGMTNWQPRIKFETDGRVLVDIDANVTDELLQKIRSAGGTIVRSAPRFHSVRASVPLASLESLASLTNVTFIRRAVKARVFTGSVDSEGDVTHGADLARADFFATGAGVKVGVISDSVDFLANAQATGDLPANVIVLPGQSGTDISGSTGEGTAMLEIVNDLAPGAQLYFATAYGSEAGFAQNILDLRSNGCNIIVDDVHYFDESPFQDGIVAQAVNSVTADGALYFSAAGNNGNQDSQTSGTWEGDFVDGGKVTSRSAIGSQGEFGRLHNFGSGNFDNVIGPSGTYDVTLFWSDPMGASTNDYDLFTLNSSGMQVDDLSDSQQSGTQDPFEICTAQANDRIVIVKNTGAARFLHLQLETDGAGSLSNSTPGNICGHPAATNAFAVAAVDANDAYPGLFTIASINESFCSDGPRRVFFNADGSPITPSDFSSTGGIVRLKPDISAADGVSSSVPGFTPFYGTSAAAPHAAAIAALLLSYDPALTPDEIRAAFTGTALDIGAPGFDRDSGAGIVMAMPSLQWVASQLLKPAIQSVTLTNGAVNLAWSAQSNHVYQVQYATDLNLANWTNLGSPVTAADSTVIATDCITADPQRFYRVQLVH